MRVLQVTTDIDPASGGPTRSCKGLCRALSRCGADVTLLVLAGKHPFEDPCGVKICYAADRAGKGGKDMVGDLNVSSFDLVHVQGLWSLKLHKVIKACRKAKVPYVVSPRGMLDPWALSVKKWKKRLGMFLYQMSDLKHAAAFHATAELEATNVRLQGLKQSIIVAPNGVDVPEEIPKVNVRRNGEPKTAIFLSRLHPGKGLLTLAEAWAEVRPQGWVMRIVGPDYHGHKAEVLARLDALGISHANEPSRTSTEKRQPPITSSWQFVDMVSDDGKWYEYSAADLLVHPSVSENFGITIAEGLAAGLPVITTQGTPWRDIEEYSCGWWIENASTQALACALREAFCLSDAVRHAMGERGRRLVEEKCTWKSIASTMLGAYGELLTR